MIDKIVSLTPSITEILFALGAGKRIAGVTDTCDFPPQANRIPHICSWFEPDMDRIRDLNPGLVIGLENVHKQLSPAFAKAGITLLLLQPATVGGALSDMVRLGDLLDLSNAAQTLVKNLEKRMETLKKNVATLQPEQRLTVSRVLDVEKDRLIVAGPGSFQFDVIACSGGINVTGGIDEDYPKISFEQFKKWDPDMIFFCGSDHRYLSMIKKDPVWKDLRAIQNGRIFQFDCGLTCRTGPRILDMAELLYNVLYGDVA